MSIADGDENRAEGSGDAASGSLRHWLPAAGREVNLLACFKASLDVASRRQWKVNMVSACKIIFRSAQRRRAVV